MVRGKMTTVGSTPAIPVTPVSSAMQMGSYPAVHITDSGLAPFLPTTFQQMKTAGDAAHALDRLVHGGEIAFTMGLSKGTVSVNISGVNRYASTAPQIRKTAQYSGIGYGEFGKVAVRHVKVKRASAKAVIKEGHFKVGIYEEGLKPVFMQLEREGIPIAYLSFNATNGALNIYNMRTYSGNEGLGYMSLLQRLAFLMAGMPEVIQIREILSTNPSYDEIAEAFLLASSNDEFALERTKERLERIFAAEIMDMRLLNWKSIPTRGPRRIRGNGFLGFFKTVGYAEEKVEPGASFDLKIKLRREKK